MNALKQNSKGAPTFRCPGPSCNAPIQDYIIRGVLSKEEYDDYIEMGLQSVLNSGSFVKCPNTNCKLVIEIVTQYAKQSHIMNFLHADCRLHIL